MWCGSGRLCLHASVAGKNKFRFFLVIWGKFVVEEVVTKGESVAVPIKRVEGSKSAFQIRVSVDALERVSGGRDFLA